MKKRTGVTVLSILSLVFLVATVALFVVNNFVPSVTSGFVPDFVGLNKTLLNCLTKFEEGSLKYNLFAWGIIVLFVGLLIPWLIVSLKRKRYSVWAFAILWLFVSYIGELEHIIFSGINGNKELWYLWIEVGCFIVSKVLCIVLFIVDMVTGKVKPYVSEDNYEAVPAVEPAPAPVAEEAPKADEVLSPIAEEPAPVEVEPEEKPVPVKKAPAKKAPAKKAPAKAPAKKPEAKKAPAKKAPAKAAEKKAPARVTEKKIYHITQRVDLNKWQVKAENGDKAVKLFNTQREAKTYAMGLVDNDIGYIRVHSKEGKIRKTSKRTYNDEK